MANVFGEKVSIDTRKPQQMIEEAVATAMGADVVVAVLGEASELSGEAASRSDISLPTSQKALLAALTKTGKPVVVLLLSGRPLTISDEVAQATAVVQGWFGGHEAASGFADVLFGAYNPSVS
jgi:beta-glucosidase